MPVHCGSGSHTFKGDKYRFLIMERFGKDLQKIFQTGKKKFPPKAAYTIAVKVLDTLEYIHAQGYVHNDIKAQNLLLGEFFFFHANLSMDNLFSEAILSRPRENT